MIKKFFEFNLIEISEIFEYHFENCEQREEDSGIIFKCEVTDDWDLNNKNIINSINLALKQHDREILLWDKVDDFVYFFVIENELLKKYKEIGFKIIDQNDYETKKIFTDGSVVSVFYEKGKWFVNGGGYGIGVNNMVDAQDYFFRYQHKRQGVIEWIRRKYSST
jgi:hypothetical protein